MEMRICMCRIVNKLSFVLDVAVTIGVVVTVLLGVFGVIEMGYCLLGLVALGVVRYLNEFISSALEKPMIRILKDWAKWNARRVFGTDQEIAVNVEVEVINFTGPSDEKFTRLFARRCEEMCKRLGYTMPITYNGKYITI